MLENLNKQQKEAVISDSQYIRVIAGAGSGKTRVLTSRIAYLVKHFNVLPYKILAITFTNKAANEMKERVTSLIDGDILPFVSTIHSLCVRILREDIAYLNYPQSFLIIDSSDQRSIINEGLNDLNIDKKFVKTNAYIGYISDNKTSFIDCEVALNSANHEIDKAKAQIYEFYQQRLKQLNAVDFDDLLIFTYQLFLENPLVLEKWQRRFSHILVDEFQDVDNIQYNIIKFLVGVNNSLYVVGDPDQTIYSWRGANVDIIMNLENDYKNTQTIILKQNYRSTTPILMGANSLIINNSNRVKKELFTNIESDDLIKHHSAKDQDLEAFWIAKEIDNLRSQNVSYNDIAILYRANYLSRSIEKGLRDYGVPYAIYGGTRFYDRQEIKDALSYLRLVAIGDDLSFIRIINNPRRNIGPKSIELIRKKSHELNLSLFDTIINAELFKGKTALQVNKFSELILKTRNTDLTQIDQILKELLEESGYIKMLEDANEKERIDNINELFNDIHTFMQQNPESDVLEYLQFISLYTDKDDYDFLSSVSLMTIHAAKGLEFDYVFVVGMSDGIFPSNISMSEGLIGLEEERRLAYVAFTRAKKKLYLTESSGFDFISGKNRMMSRFINEIDDRFIDRHQEFRAQSTFTITNKAKNNVKQNVTKNKLKSGQKVVHSMFGEGIVVSVNNKIATIAFSFPHGVKNIQENHQSLQVKK